MARPPLAKASLPMKTPSRAATRPKKAPWTGCTMSSLHRNALLNSWRKRCVPTPARAELTLNGPQATPCWGTLLAWLPAAHKGMEGVSGPSVACKGSFWSGLQVARIPTGRRARSGHASVVLTVPATSLRVRDAREGTRGTPLTACGPLGRGA